MLAEIIKRTLRVPALIGPAGNSESIARQLDIALLSVGFKLSRELLEHLSSHHPAQVTDLGKSILTAVRELVGDHVEHNVYFAQFPEGIPDTLEFWWTEITRVLFTGQTLYGRYQHSYQEMLARHNAFLPSAKDRVTLLHLGATLPEETISLYHMLAESAVPLNDADRALAKTLAELCVHDPQPSTIPIRETRALINQVRLQNQQPLLLDTVTDILRLACALSDGDVSLQELTYFVSFSRKTRRVLLGALDDIIARAPGQLADVKQYRQRWKRLGECLHPHEYHYRFANDVFAVARGEKQVYSLEAQIEMAFQQNDLPRAITLLAHKPGAFVRNLDHLLREASSEQSELIRVTLERVANRVSGRVLLSLREHLQNRAVSHTSRIFTNKKGRAWLTEEVLEPFDPSIVNTFTQVLDREILKRLPRARNVIVDPAIASVALPLSEKNKASGFAVLPRGSLLPVERGILRFFVYWKQKEKRTDYDLSAILFDRHFNYREHLSYTNLRAMGSVHSGDLTDATHGATEFVDLDLTKVQARYIIPTINIFAGENFNVVEECFFGMMLRTEEQDGKPFEPATVQMKAEVRGNGRVALPIVFIRDDKRAWSARWMHLYMKGQPNFNRVETNHESASILVRSILERHYLDVRYLVELLKQNSDPENKDAPTLFIGLAAPEQREEGMQVYTLDNLHTLIPA